jgi:hypothetical protein
VGRNKIEQEDIVRIRIQIAKTERITKRQEKRIAYLTEDRDNIYKRTRESEVEFDKKIRRTILKRRVQLGLSI